MATATPKTQDGDIVRAMTDEEVAAYQLACNEIDARASEQAKLEALKKATIAKLGLTVDEVAALLS